MGTAEFGIPTLRALNERFTVAAVVTRPDMPKGRGRSLGRSPVKEAALELGIPVLTPEKTSATDFIGKLRHIGADLFYVVAFRILPSEVFTMPPLGTVNLHASLLPDYRGAAPINRAVINGDTVTGLTTFFIDEHIDTGDILLQEKVIIGPDETAGELYDRMKIIGAGLSLRTAELIADGRAVPVRQPDGLSRPAPKLRKEDGRIDWSLDARTVHNHVRGMNPSPGAFTGWDRGPLKIHRTVVADETSPGNPGMVVSASPREGFTVSCGRGALRIVELQPPGKKPMDGASFVRGYGVEAGQPIARDEG